MDAFLHDLSDVYKTLQTHKRYKLRLAAIVSISLGSMLNFAAFLTAFIAFRSGDAPRYLTVWASICVSRVATRLQTGISFSLLSDVYSLAYRSYGTPST